VYHESRVFLPDEVIIADDGSQENTKQLIADFQRISSTVDSYFGRRYQ
jgi:glycosyltransferase involved in cell wall biosynthesis